MRKSLLIALSLFSLRSLASYDGALLEKVFHTGYVPVGRDFSLNCKIYSNKVVVQFFKLDLKKTVEFRQDIDSNITELIEQASKGEITKRMAPTDIGIRKYTATQVLPNDTTRLVDLGSIIDSQSITVNHSEAASSLKSYIDKVCETVLNK